MRGGGAGDEWGNKSRTGPHGQLFPSMKGSCIPLKRPVTDTAGRGGAGPLVPCASFTSCKSSTTKNIRVRNGDPPRPDAGDVKSRFLFGGFLLYSNDCKTKSQESHEKTPAILFCVCVADGVRTTQNAHT